MVDEKDIVGNVHDKIRIKVGIFSKIRRHFHHLQNKVTSIFEIETFGQHLLIKSEGGFSIGQTCKPIDNSEGVRLHDVTHIARNETNL